MRQAEDALASAVQDREQDGQALPRSLEEEAALDYDRTMFHDPGALLVPVEVSA